MRALIRRLPALVGPSAVLLLALGCGSGEPRCVPVSGKVTFDGGKVPGPGFIYFTTDGTGAAGTSRPGTAEFDADGNYRAKTFVDGDGLLPGKYVLRVDCWKTPPNMDGKPVVSFIPARYQDAAQSQLTLTVEPGSKPITFNIELLSK
ncbi:MAG: hypothetical protein K2V38_20475 [Gemmataceae bacterium]|nr:hypothetical protein [Gemmataceae bacterium]